MTPTDCQDELERVRAEREECYVAHGKLITQYHALLERAERHRKDNLFLISKVAKLEEDAKLFRWLDARCGCATHHPDDDCGIVLKLTLCVHNDGREQGLLREALKEVTGAAMARESKE